MRRWSIGPSRPRSPTRCCTTRPVRGVMAEAHVNVRASGEVAARVGRALGVALPIEPNTATTVGERSILWLGPDEWLVVDSESSAAEIEAHVRAAFAPDWGSAVDVSANRTIVQLPGPHPPDVLAPGCSLDPPPRSLAPRPPAPTLLAQT